MRAAYFALALYASFFATAALRAEDQTASSGPRTVITGNLDLFYSHNLNRPDSAINKLHSFDTVPGELSLGAGMVTLERKGGYLGFRADGGWGTLYDTIHAKETWLGPNRYISQAYVTLRADPDSSARLEVGKFLSLVGAEGPYAHENNNYSRSLLFVLGGPCYHFGARAWLPVRKDLAVAVQALNGWDNVIGNRGKAFGFTAVWTRGRVKWTHTYLGGPSRLDGTQESRHIYDGTAVWTLSGRWSGYVEWLYAHETYRSGERSPWYGAGTVVRYAPFNRLSFSPRLEWFEDAQGFSTGLKQRLMETTVTAEYRISKYFTGRLEFRRDWSNQPFFEVGPQSNPARAQNTLAIVLMAAWKAER